ncbi:MAG TPA: tRNA lysidine(34) synthetase TilS [Rhizomicrobium sp.]|jgi:tRNA(Ile)-lysidine synthase|nr:tRNA lysidine(34) synthetase TilS [Rhizomicrobium sp.]
MDGVLAAGAEWPGAVAVSGGADSLALMFLLADWAAAERRPGPVVLTVDHGLQPHATRVARDVVKRAAQRGLCAHVLRWTGRKPSADIEAAARDARYRLMGTWCRSKGPRSLFIAHSLEDQAETFLLRLMRGSGVDGLAAMTPVAPFPGPGCENLRIVRPLLGVQRAKLRAFLLRRNEPWLEDPMNADIRFARARLRGAWPALREMGFSTERIAAAAGHLARARAALEQAASDLLAISCRSVENGVLLDGGAIAAVPEEIGLRALARVLMQVSGRHYRPRFERLERVAAAIRLQELRGGRTLHGCCIRPASKRDACFGSRTVHVAPEVRRSRTGGDAGG